MIGAIKIMSGIVEKLRESGKIILSIAVCQAAGMIGSYFTRPAIPNWYATLAKPSFTPPDWVFAPAWIMLYILMGISFYLVWRRGWTDYQVKKALIIFLIQLGLNAFWSVAFFGLRSPLAGMIVIVALWVAILQTMIGFSRLSRGAVLLLVPYICWVSFAAWLNFSILRLNS